MFIVTDLEATCWEGRPHHDEMEIIEIGAVKLDLSRARLTDAFSSLVRPRLHPALSEFCTRLTGITQSDMLGQHDFATVYPAFQAWCGSPHKHILAAWGDYDRNQLQKDLARYGLEWGLPLSYMNISQLYRERFGGPKRSLKKACDEQGLAFRGQPHRGLDDARMAALVLGRIFGLEIEDDTEKPYTYSLVYLNDRIVPYRSAWPIEPGMHLSVDQQWYTVLAPAPYAPAQQPAFWVEEWRH
jgi:inhibitor of KinA sporulation pathway (predicted exonuclease)